MQEGANEKCIHKNNAAGRQHLVFQIKQNVEHDLMNHSSPKPYCPLAHTPVSGLVEQ